MQYYHNPPESVWPARTSPEKKTRADRTGSHQVLGPSLSSSLILTPTPAPALLVLWRFEAPAATAMTSLCGMREEGLIRLSGE
jgi:hypothetical protein